MNARSFKILVRPDNSALVLGGYSAPRLGGDKATARDRDERPLIPATALRGALRIELERLLRGLEPAGLACSANRAEADSDVPAYSCPVCRLFGEPGHGTGTLRLEDAVLAREIGEEPRLRPSVAVSRRTGAAVEKHLAFVETTGSLESENDSACFKAEARLVGRGNLDSDQSLNEDERNLRAACAALRAIGGGRAKGLGWVQCSIREAAGGAARITSAVRGEAAPESVVVRFHSLAPLHLGLGRQLGFFQGTHSHAPGSTVRGALAFALLESGVAADSLGFQSLFGPNSTASFGSARRQGDVPSATRRKCRPASHVFDDLVGELVRRAAAKRDRALAVTGRGGCVHADCDATKILSSEVRNGASELQLRVRTLTALNRLTGTSMDRKLYSVEAVEPGILLTSEIRGLAPEGAALLTDLDRHEVWLGGKRAKGMGRCRLEVKRSPAPEVEGVRRSVTELDSALRKAWAAITAVSGPQDPILGEAEMPVCLVLEEPWEPECDGDQEAALRQGPLTASGFRLFDAFVILAEEGRFVANEAARFGGDEAVRPGEEAPRRLAAPGSVYVYAASRALVEERLDTWVQAGRLGSGERRALAWGRYVIRGPEIDF